MCGPGVDVRPMPIDDAWMRDSGPIIVRAPDGARHAVHFRFNAWGEKYEPYDRDAADRRPDRARARVPGARSTAGARRRLDRGRRCRNAGDDRALPPQREPQSPICPRWRSNARSDSGSVSSGSSGSATGSPRTPKRTATSTTSSRSSAPARALLQGCSDPAEPEPRDRRRQRRATAGRRDRSRRDRDAAVRGRVGRNRAGAVRQLLRRERGRRRADHGGGRGRRRARVDRVPSIRAARSSRSRARSWRTVAAACTASPSRSPA